jgi:hypothetical protein
MAQQMALQDERPGPDAGAARRVSKAEAPAGAGPNTMPELSDSDCVTGLELVPEPELDSDSKPEPQHVAGLHWSTLPALPTPATKRRQETTRGCALVIGISTGCVTVVHVCVALGGLGASGHSLRMVMLAVIWAEAIPDEGNIADRAINSQPILSCVENHHATTRAGDNSTK